jgi:hypothetical protein
MVGDNHHIAMSVCSPDGCVFLYMLHPNAKPVKTSLEKNQLLHRQFQMMQAKPEDNSHDDSISDGCIVVR